MQFERFYSLKDSVVGSSRISVNSPCRSPEAWPWTDHAQISLIHSPTPPKCSTKAIVALINNQGIVYHQFCSSSYLDYRRRYRPDLPLSAMEIKSELDTDKAARATVTIAASNGLCRVSEVTETFNSPSPTQLL